MIVAGIALTAAAAVGVAARQAQQELEVLRGADAPPNAIWIDSLDLSKMVQRRQTPRAGRIARAAGRGGGARPQGSRRRAAGSATDHARRRHLSRTASARCRSTSSSSISRDRRRDSWRWSASTTTRAGRARSPSRSGSTTRRCSISDVLQRRQSAAQGGRRSHRRAFSRAARSTTATTSSTGDNADWGGGLIFLKPGATAKPESWTFPSEPAPPIASGWPAAPRINPPRITGGTPGRPFVFRIPATGEAPLDVRRAQSAGGPHARSEDRRHQRRDRAAKAAPNVDDHGDERARQGDAHADDRRRQGRARADAAARLELVERLGPVGRRREGARRGRRDGIERPRRARLSVRQHRRRLGRAARRERRAAAEREVSRT